MRTNLKPDNSSAEDYVAPRPWVRYRFSADDDDAGGESAQSPERLAAARQHLPYAVELWDDAFGAVLRVLALAATNGAAYAAYYAAMRQFPDRNLLLRDGGRVMARTIAPRH